MKTDGVRVIAAAVTSGELSAWTSLGKFRDVLASPAEIDLHDFVAGHVTAFGKLPDPATVHSETGVQLVAPPEPATFYLRKVRKRHIERSIRKTAQEVQGLLDPHDEDYDPSGALHKFRDLVGDLLGQQAQHHVVDFRDAKTAVYDAWIAATSGPDDEGSGLGVMSGWPTLDKNSGGLEGGEVMSIVGRPASGKSFMLLWLAHHAWANQGASPVVSTQEMSAKFMMQRLAAMHSRVPLSPIRYGEIMDPKQHARFKEAMHVVQDAPNPLLIADGKMAATVPDLIATMQTFGGSVLYVDGAYLLQHADRRLNRYQRVAENMDLLKAAATDLDIPVVCSWQFSREAAKKMKKSGAEDLDLEDIGYSDAVGQHSSIVLGLLQEEDAASVMEREVAILKGRSGETGKFHVRWDFDTCDFSEPEHGGDVTKMKFTDHGL